MLRLKKRIYQEINKAFLETKKSLKNLFDKVDVDNSNQIDLDEFKSMFERMKVKLTDKEVRDIFNSVDFDWSGKVTYPEFIADFNKTVNTDIMTLINEEKERAEVERNGASGIPQINSYGTYGSNSAGFSGTGGVSAQQTQQMQLQTKIAIMEAREKQMGRKMETAMRVLNHA